MSPDLTRIRHRIARVYRDLDYAGRRSFELRTGVTVIDRREREARSGYRP